MALKIKPKITGGQYWPSHNFMSFIKETRLQEVSISINDILNSKTQNHKRWSVVPFSWNDLKKPSITAGGQYWPSHNFTSFIKETRLQEVSISINVILNSKTQNLTLQVVHRVLLMKWPRKNLPLQQAACIDFHSKSAPKGI